MMIAAVMLGKGLLQTFLCRLKHLFRPVIKLSTSDGKGKQIKIRPKVQQN